MFSGGFMKFSEYCEKFEMARLQIRDRLKDNAANKNMYGQEQFKEKTFVKKAVENM
jgi:hypothetical protein